MKTSLLWINQEKRRYYRVRVYQDLLGDWVLSRSWGALDSSKGGCRVEVIEPQRFDDLLAEIEKRRRQRDYVLVEE
jgi:hypothetical protein